jgi:foldase protein PrsA
MRKSTFVKSLVSVGLATACVFTVTGCTDTSEETKYTGGVAATVNGAEIEEDTITQAIEDIRTQMGTTDEDSWGEWMATNSYTPETVREEIIDSYIDQELVKQACEEKGITADEEEVNQYVESMKSNYDSDEAWQSALEAVGLTEDQYRENIELSLTSQELRTEVTADLEEPTDEEVLESAQTYATYYDGAKKSSHIRFDSSDESQAQEVLEKLKSGELDFETAAETYSKDTSTSEDGGNMGWDVLSSYDTEYTTALADLNKGDISDLVTASDGIHIIMCTDVFEAPEELTSLDQIPDEIVEYLRSMLESSNQSTAYYEWLDEAREAADIVINDMPEAVPYNVDMSKYETEDESTDDTATDTTSDESTDASTETNSDESTDAEVTDGVTEAADEAETEATDAADTVEEESTSDTSAE